MTEPYRFKVGDKVKWHGDNGVVKRVALGVSYPIVVDFDGNSSASFTPDGKFFSWQTEPSLKLRKFKKKEVAKPTQPPTFKVGDKVIYRRAPYINLKGQIIGIYPVFPLPIIVISNREDGSIRSDWFTLDGKHPYGASERVLFLEEELDGTK